MPAAAETPRLKALKSAPLGVWVILSENEDTILAAGATFEEVSEKAEALGDDIVILKTPTSWTSFSV